MIKMILENGYEVDKIDVLDKGSVSLMNMMPYPYNSDGITPDRSIVNCARVSFLGESKGDLQDKKLLLYLMKNKHTSPFEMVEFQFKIVAPVLVW